MTDLSLGAMSATAAGSTPPPPSRALSEHDQELLECERSHWGAAPGKEQVVFERFGMSLPAYYQRLYQLCQTAEALEYDSVLARHILDTADQVTARRLRAMNQEGGRG